jgi:hypothetical protein
VIALTIENRTIDRGPSNGVVVPDHLQSSQSRSWRRTVGLSDEPGEANGQCQVVEVLRITKQHYRPRADAAVGRVYRTGVSFGFAKALPPCSL